MAYQFKREPLTPVEADKLYQACNTVQEKLIIWILLDTGLRVSELCSLTPQNILWQQKSIRISGKGGPYGKKTKKRVVPMSNRVQSLLEHYFAITDKFPIGSRQVQKIVKEIANRAQISKTVTPQSLLNQLCKFSHKYLKFYPQILSKNEPWLHSNFGWA
jgi:integrase/recombinase XerD